jgi:uncharacterized repeat protein (TIGR01451 family)
VSSTNSPTDIVVNVSYTGTADSSDYAGNVSAVTFLGSTTPGTYAATITLNIIADGAVDAAETIILTLNPTAPTVTGVIPVYTVTITEVSLPPIATATPASTSSIADTQDDSTILSGSLAFDPAINKIGLLALSPDAQTDDMFEWVITVTNTGGMAGTNVVIRDVLAPELRLERVDAANAQVVVDGQVITVTLATLASGETFQFSIFTSISADGRADNTACVSSAFVAVRCVNAHAIRTLPQTGMRPFWAVVLRWSLLSVLVLGLGVLLRQQSRIASSA